ncbi:unnamed protein product [Scytosiphon promiscuus]
MPEKRCHYDVLGLERDASDEDIKRAYRRLALFWHPDKNAAEDREDSSDVFRLITEAYAVLSDPKRKAAYDRDGHPPSTAKKSPAGAPNKAASAAGPTPPHPPTAPTAPASAHGYPSASSQQGYGGWGGEGGGGAWQGMAMGGGYGQGWEQQQQQQQAYPFQQGGYMQQQQQFQPQPGPFPPQQEGAFGYGSQYGQEAYPYPYQQQQQGAQSWAPHDAYNNYDNAYHDYGAPPSAAVPPEPASGPPSTELALPEESPQGGGSPYPGGHPAAASQGMVAYAGGGYPHQAVAMPQHAAAHQGMMAPHNGCYPQQGGPLSYSGLPPAVWAPPSTNPPSSDSEESSDSESEGGDQNLAVARYGSPEPPESTPSRRGSLFRRSPPGGSYPTETRTDLSPGGIIPRHPNKAYPRETRYVPPKSASQQRQRQEQERPGVSRGDSGLVVKLHMGKSKPSPSTGSSASAGALARRNAGSSRRGSEGSVGGLMQEMDRVFGSILGGSAFGAGLSVDMADETGSRRSLSRGFSVGGGGGGGSSRNGASGGGGGVAATMMSSHTVVSGKSRTLFARTERTVVGMDGTRETDVSALVSRSRVGAQGCGVLMRCSTLVCKSTGTTGTVLREGRRPQVSGAPGAVQPCPVLCWWPRQALRSRRSCERDNDPLL